MQPYWPFDGFFMKWKQYISVICWLVVIETETKELNTFPGNRSDVMIDSTSSSRDIVTFTNLVMPICPPPNNLHLLCDVKLVNKFVNCSERAFVIQLCLDLFENVYVNSNWILCGSDFHPCVDIIVLLQDNGYINRSGLSVSSTERSWETSTSSTSESTISSSTTMSNSNDSFNVTGIYISSTKSYQSTNNVTISMDTTVSLATISPTLAADSGDISSTENAEDQRSATYIYALIGILVVFIEIAILFFIYFYQKKRQRSRPYRHPSKESLREEIIAPETTSPTEALVLNNLVYDDEDIFKQDQKIYQSYLNLRYIDDSSVECTPEKIILK